MKESNINIVIKYLAKEELSSEEFELVNYLKESNAEEFEEIQTAYDCNIFSKLSFDSSAGFTNVKEKLKEENKSIKIPFHHRKWIQIAASALILISIGILGGAFFSWDVSLNNQTSQLKSILLPDGSEVILDKKASIHYSRTLFTKFDRQVSLHGRAHFHITKNPEHAFVVHNPMTDVQVLGTQFTINQMPDITQIVLEEGIVWLSGPEMEENILLNNAGSEVLLSNGIVVKEAQVSPNLYASWTQERLSFNQSTVNEVFQFLEDSYGIHVGIEDSSVLNHTLYGTAPSDDPYLIIDAINKILNTKIESNKKTK